MARVSEPRLGARDACPCGSGEEYAACCAAYVIDGEPAPTAEALMRSRYTAYVVGDRDHLLRTWHPRTRPADVDVSESVRFTRLEIIRTEGGTTDDVMGQVEFRAYWKSGAGNARQDGVLHEASVFHRRAGRWFYMDGS